MLQHFSITFTIIMIHHCIMNNCLIVIIEGSDINPFLDSIVQEKFNNFLRSPL
eukprot:00492.XXX_193_348_1 [CDS] Oithona nana genome sequencing.